MQNQRQSPKLLIALCCAYLGGCVVIDGGAVEARWVIRNSSGNPISCAASQIATIRLSLAPVGGGADPCTRGSSAAKGCPDGDCCRFECVEELGVTPFMIPAGDYAMSLEPRDQAGTTLTEANGVRVPTPIVRSVTSAQVTSLDVNLIIVNL